MVAASPLFEMFRNVQMLFIMANALNYTFQVQTEKKGEQTILGLKIATSGKKTGWTVIIMTDELN